MTSSSEVTRASLLEPTRPRGLVVRLRALTLRDVVVLTSIPIVVVILLLTDATVRFSRAIQFDDWWSARASVAGMFSDRVHSIATLPERVALRQGLDANDPDPAILRLAVAGNDWDAAHGDPMRGWGEWADAVLSYGQTSIDVRIRKRGDNSIHWTTDKRTMTVRTPRDDFYKRYRNFALSVKDPVPAYLANRLAREFGVLAPATEVVPVFLNNQFYGIFRFIETIDESMLRPFDRMPGNVFRADAAERGDYFKGVPRNVFDNPSLWDRVAANDRWTSAGSGQLRLVLEDLRGGTLGDHLRLINRFDRDDLARLLAYLLVVGDPYHMDVIHNQFLYEDPSTQRLHPIPWDIRLQDLRRPNGTLNDLFQALLRDPRLSDQVLRIAKEGVEGGAIGQVADSLMAALRARHGNYLRFDRLRTGLVPDIGDPERSAQLIRGNLTELARWFGSDTVAFAATRGAGLVVVDFETRGLASVDLTGFEGDWPDGARLFADRDLDGQRSAGDREIPVRPDGPGRVALARPVPLLSAWNTSGRGIVAGTMPYRFFVMGGAGSARPTLKNRLTGNPAALTPWEANVAISAPTGWHPWRYPSPTGRHLKVAGTVRVDTTWRLTAEDTLTIEPGTTLRLGPDVSIVSRGLVRAVGTAGRPIRFVPADSIRPWGTFALLEHGADGSVLRHVEFVRGGGALVDRIEYIGMVNVHRVRGVVVDSVGFIENLRSDDTFHALHSEVILTNSRFVRANSDAVDFDVATGEIRNNVFQGSGGDAIDLMTSTPLVIGNRIEAAGDKGISIGEQSAPFLFDNRIVNSPAGIEIKDRSTPVILNNEIRGVGVGLGIRRKNWRYGGSGFGLIVNSVIADAARPFQSDSAGRLTAIGVAGLDSGATAPGDLTWLYAERGIELVNPAGPGLPGPYRRVPPRPPIAVLRFEDDFRDPTDGWVGTGRITRVEKRRDVLVVEAEGGPGTVERGVEWATDGAGGIVVAEVAGRDLATGWLVVETSTGVIRAPLTGLGRLNRFQLATAAVPAGRVRAVRLEIEPTPGLSHIQRSSGLSVLRAGRLEIRSVSLYPAPPAAARR